MTKKIKLDTPEKSESFRTDPVFGTRNENILRAREELGKRVSQTTKNNE